MTAGIEQSHLSTLHDAETAALGTVIGRNCRGPFTYRQTRETG